MKIETAVDRMLARLMSGSTKAQRAPIVARYLRHLGDGPDHAGTLLRIYSAELKRIDKRRRYLIDELSRLRALVEEERAELALLANNRLYLKGAIRRVQRWKRRTS